MSWKVTVQHPGEEKRRVVAAGYPTRSSAYRARLQLIHRHEGERKKFFLEEVSPRG